MPAKPRKVPAYRLHKPTGQAVRLDGRDHYLGRHATEASHEAYRRIVAEWLSGARPEPARRTPRPDDGPSIEELILAFWTQHAERHYRHPDGTQTGELSNFRDSLRPLRQL